MKSKIDGDALATSATKQDSNTKLHWDEKYAATDSIGKHVIQSAPINNIAEAREAAKATSGEDFWPDMERLADNCDEALRKEGYPAAMQSVMPYGKDKWWPSPADFPHGYKPGDKIMIGFKFTQMHAGEFSNAWYAAEVGHLCREALSHVANGKVGEPWLYKLVFYIASIRQSWEWRHVHSPSILTGQKSRKNLCELRTSQNNRARDQVERRRELVRELKKQTKLKGGALDNFLKQKLADQYGINVGARTLREDRRALGI